MLDEIAERVAGFRLNDCPSVAIETAKLAIADTVGVTLAGSSSEAAQAIRSTLAPMAGSGNSLIFGTRIKCDSLNAALINGVAAHALDYDDCGNTMGGHPSAPVVPALWALAEERGASGEAVLAAYVVGVEMESKLGLAVNFHHYEKGWHPTATLGVFGAAAACGRLLELSPSRIATGLALAASMASGIKANFGSMAKPFHVGQAARSGLLAAKLAENDFTANVDALTHPQGFFEVYNGAGEFNAAALLDSWGQPWDLDNPGIAFKQYPCCASTHPAIDALLGLRELHGLRPDTVESIRSWTHPRRFRHTDRPDPGGALDGKFSVQYVLARALLDGEVRLDHFTDEAVRDGQVRELMGRITAQADPEATMDTTEHFYATVEVTMLDGRRFDAFIDRPHGRDRAHPLPEGTLGRKFADCAGQVLPRAAAEAVYQLILEVDTVRKIEEISHILADTAIAGDAAKKAMAV